MSPAKIEIEGGDWLVFVTKGNVVTLADAGPYSTTFVEITGRKDGFAAKRKGLTGIYKTGSEPYPFGPLRVTPTK